MGAHGPTVEARTRSPHARAPIEEDALTGFPPIGVDVLEVTDGQDRGARFSLHGTSATLGRAPTVDVMLTDPAVAPQHARLRVSEGRLRIDDLGSGAATQVNGAPVAESVALSLGDRLTVGATELTVRWTPGAPGGTRPGWPGAPGGAPAWPVSRPATAPPPPPPTRAAPAPAPGRLQVPAAALGLALLGLVCLAVPVLDDGPDSVSLWSIGSAELRALGLLAVMTAGAAASLWLAVAVGRPLRLPPGAPAVGIGVAGGALAGVALLLATADVGAGRGAGVLLVGAVGLGLLATAGVGAADAASRAPATRRGPREGAVIAAGAAAGGIMATVAAFLPWLERGAFTLGAFDAGVLTARGLLPLSLATIGAGVMAPVAAAGAGRREAVLAAVVACGLGAATVAFGVTAAAVLRPGIPGPGAGLAVAGGVVTLIPSVAGALALLDRRAV